MLHIDVVRQSVYWVTGSFNYVYPTFMLFWYMYELFKNFKSDFNKNLFSLVILAFFATATVEQAGMMSFGTTVLLLIYSFIKNKKSDIKGCYKKIIIVLLASALGLASVILAPSQFIRIGLEENEEILNDLKRKHKILLYIFSKNLCYKISATSFISYIFFNIADYK